MARTTKPRADEPRPPHPAFDPRRRDRSDDADAFMPDPGSGPARVPDDLAENLAEEFVEAATTGEAQGEELMDATFPEEIGGPFIETAAGEELIDDVDDGNPPDATREPLPLPNAGLTTSPPEELSEDPADDADAGRGQPPGPPDPVDPAPGSAELNREIPSRRSPG